jgi:hypothetical protein
MALNPFCSRTRWCFLPLVTALLIAAPSQAVEPWDRWPLPVKEPSPPILRLELGHGPAWYHAAPEEDDALVRPGIALSTGVVVPLSDALATGLRGLHARFGGTLETSHLSAILVPLELHSGFDAPRGFWFGLMAGGYVSSSEDCGHAPLAFGLTVGARTRVQGPLGLSLSFAALGASGVCNAVGRPPGPLPKASLGGGVHSVLQLTYDVGSR